MLKGIEEALDGHDERFGAQGEFLLRLSDELIVEIERVLFAYKLKDKEDPVSIEEMRLVLEGPPKEMAKILAFKRKKMPTQVPGDRLGIVLKMHKGLLDEIIEMTRSGQGSTVSSFLIGSDRNINVFDFNNYDIISIVTD